MSLGIFDDPTEPSFQHFVGKGKFEIISLYVYMSAGYLTQNVSTDISNMHYKLIMK